MKNYLFALVTGLLFNLSDISGQEVDSLQKETDGIVWDHSAEIMFYFLDPFFPLPIYHVNRGWLHLEGRYNYEDQKSFSAWMGYNFRGGRDFQFLITPMAGGVVGQTNGITIGLELTFDFKGLELYSESEYIFNFKEIMEDFFYNWTDFTYSPLDWFRFGLSFQKTRIYETSANYQTGFILGGEIKIVDLSGYLYNPFSEDVYFILSISVDFQTF